MTQKEIEEMKKAEILKRIGKTNKLSINDAIYIENHHWDFDIPMFKKKVKI